MVKSSTSLEKLLDIMRDYKSAFVPRHPDNPVRKALELRRQIEREIDSKEFDVLYQYERAIRNPEVQEILRISLPSSDDPKIIDLGEHLELKKGRIYGINLPMLSPASFKGMQVSGGILLELITGGELGTFVGVGVFNSALATKYYAKRLGFDAKYWVPRSLPKHLVDILRNDRFEVNHENPFALPEGWEKITDSKNACYATLVQYLKRNKELRENCFYFPHSELASAFNYPLARSFIDAIDVPRDVLISPIGAGTFFSPFVLAGFADENYLVEGIDGHPMSDEHDIPTRCIEDIAELPLEEISKYYFSNHKNARSALSRKYGENPFIMKSFWGKLDGTYLIGAKADYKVLKLLKDKGVKVGMTSAGAVVAAREIVQETGKTAFVPIFERALRDYSVEKVPWLFRNETPLQRIALTAAVAGYLAAATLFAFGTPPDAPGLGRLMCP